MFCIFEIWGFELCFPPTLAKWLMAYLFRRVWVQWCTSLGLHHVLPWGCITHSCWPYFTCCSNIHCQKNALSINLIAIGNTKQCSSTSTSHHCRRDTTGGRGIVSPTAAPNITTTVGELGFCIPPKTSAICSVKNSFSLNISILYRRVASHRAT